MIILINKEFVVGNSEFKRKEAAKFNEERQLQKEIKNSPITLTQIQISQKRAVNRHAKMLLAIAAEMGVSEKYTGNKEK